LDEVDESNIDSVLMVTDVFGFAHIFLDGTFPLGTVRFEQPASFVSVEKSNGGPIFFGHSKFRSGTLSSTLIEPTIIDMPLLGERKMRDLARLSSIARDLAWYIVRVVKEMKDAWHGSAGATGARTLGPKWVDAFRVKQTEKFGCMCFMPSQLFFSIDISI
jgi:anaphase-promoting complex subunit 4